MSAVRSKVRLYDLANDLRVDTKRLIREARLLGVNVSVPSNSISKELADKIRDKYSPTTVRRSKRQIKSLYRTLDSSGSTPTGRKIETIQFKGPLPRSKAPPFKLVYTPATLPAPLRQRPKRQRDKRTCPMCGAEFPSKSAIRTHYTADHIAAILDGKFSCRVKVAELSNALSVSDRRVSDIARRIGIKTKGGYIQPRMVKRLADKIRTVVASEATEKRGEPPKHQEIPNRPIGTIARPKAEARLPAAKSKLLRLMANGLPTNRAQRVKWRFLPPGKRPFAEIIRNLNKAAKKYGKEIYEIERLTRIDELGPTETWIGDEGFRGYVAFVFDRYSCVVLECPRTNNAAYIFGENWRLLSRLPKSELLNTRRRELERVIHTDGWFFRLTKVLAERKSR